MLKEEFENLTLRSRETISGLLYDTIERLYTSENDYHSHNNPNGINESKQEFCKRVFGGKANTAKSILAKTIRESMKGNRYCLQYEGKSEMDFDRLEKLITEQYTWQAQRNH